MVASTSAFSQWLQQAAIREAALSPDQLGLLRAAFRFRQDQGDDYYSTRLLGHFLLHCGSGLKVAAVARLLGLSRPTASEQQKLSSKQAIQQAHHRMDGRPYGKLLPRYAGPIAGFLLSHPDATRADLIDFVDRTFSVRVSRVALYQFLKKYGLDQMPNAAQGAAPTGSPADTSGPPPLLPAAVPLSVPLTLPGALPATGPAPPFSSRARSTPAPSC